MIGTRPEAIKMAPVIRALGAIPDVECVVCSTGQHGDLLGDVFRLFNMRVDVDLAAMRAGQSLNEVVAGLVAALDQTISDTAPDRVLVHGDTATTLAAALAAANRRLPVDHVEAGLRSFNPARPWPEEMNRRIVDSFSDFLFAPTVREKNNLTAERAPGRIVVTGNSGVDALLSTAKHLDLHDELRAQVDQRLPVRGGARRLLLVTGHRRENLEGGIGGVCEALLRLSRRPDVEIAYPLHPNPAAREPPLRLLQGKANVHLLPPQDYLSFVRLLQRSALVITDSGGVQEEAPVLGKPVLITRTETERCDGVVAGRARVVGLDASRIATAVEELLDDPSLYDRASTPISPYGDGRAGERIAQALAGQVVEEFTALPAPDRISARGLSRGRHAPPGPDVSTWPSSP